MEEKLIESVRSRKVLYDTNHPDYMRNKLKKQLWEEVSKEVKMSNGTDAKGLWEKLRHSFRDALRRQERLIKSGVTPGTIKQWRYQKQMGFLLRYMGNRAREGDSLDPTELLDFTYSLQEDQETRQEQEVTQELQEVIDEESTEDEFHAQLKHEFQIPVKRAKQNVIETFLKESMVKRLQRSKARREERAKLMEEKKHKEVYKSDPLYHFYMSMYEMTKVMPPSAQHTVRNRVYSAVTQMEASLLNILASYNTTDNNQPFHVDVASPSNSSASSTPAHSLYS